MGCQVYYYSGAYDAHMKRELNIDQLFTVYHEKRLIIDTILYKREHPEYTAKIMCDSGAFTLYMNMKKKGHILTDEETLAYVNDYIDFLNEWGEDLTCFVAVDTVPDPTNMDWTYAQKTWDNYLYMWEKLKPSIRHKLIPVFHYGEDFKWLRNFLEHINPDGTHIDYIGLAISLEGTRKVRINWGQECMQIIANSSNPDVKTHAFGVGVKSVLEHIDVYSTDATSYLKRAAYGMISIDDKTVYVSDVQQEKLDGKYFGEKSLAFTDAVEKTIVERGFRLNPEKCPYRIEDDVVIIESEEGTMRGKLVGTTFELDRDGYTYMLEEVPEGAEGADQMLGMWRNTKDSYFIFKFDGKGTCYFDNGYCVATTGYARARFNILDTENWMKDIKKHKVPSVSVKTELW